MDDMRPQNDAFMEAAMSGDLDNLPAYVWPVEGAPNCPPCPPTAAEEHHAAIAAKAREYLGLMLAGADTVAEPSDENIQYWRKQLEDAAHYQNDVTRLDAYPIYLAAVAFRKA